MRGRAHTAMAAIRPPRFRRDGTLARRHAMDLTKNFVKAKRPCTEGFRWFLRHYEDGGNYQELLDALVADGRINDACWLLDQFGPTDAVRTLDTLFAEAMVFAGTLEVRGNIETDGLVRAGRDIRAGGGIHVGDRLIAGGDLRCAGGIWSGDALVTGGNLRAAWGIESQGEIACGGELRAGWAVHCSGELTVVGNALIGEDLDAAEDVHCGKSLQAGGAIRTHSLRAGHGVLAGASIHCAQHLEAGWGMRADGDIVAGGAIRAGEGLEAQGEIRAGSGYGIYAGLDVQRADWESSARVCALQRPEGLTSGWWAGPAALR